MQGKISVFDEVPNNYKTLIGKKYPKTGGNVESVEFPYIQDTVKLDIIQSSHTKSPPEVLPKVWDAVSHFIRRNLQQGKGVTIKNLGTFTFSEWKTFIGSKVVEYKQPTFLMSEKLVQFYNLKNRVPYTTGKTPVVSLNYVTVATNLGMCRQAIEDCVTEITEAFVRLVSQDREVEIPFPKIGQLLIRNKHIHMDFFPKFLKDVEGIENSENGNKSSSEQKRERNIEDELKSSLPKHTSSPIPSEEIFENEITDQIPCEKETL